MIRYTHGNLLEANEKIIAHGCNAQGAMGAGVALYVRKKWPECYQKYHDHFLKYDLFLGDVIWYDGPKYIANCITQAKTGSGLQVDYDAISDTARKVLRRANLIGATSVAYPKIGAGLAGGDWEIIEGHLNRESAMARVGINVYILDREEYENTIRS